MTFRSPELLRLARLAPRCMACPRPNDGTVVAAHSNQGRDGKGMGTKAADYRVAFCCMRCHAEIDQGSAPQAERVAMWEAAHRATVGWLFEAGHLTVNAAPVEPPHAREGTATRPIKKKVAKSRPIQNAGFQKGPKRPIPSRPLRS